MRSLLIGFGAVAVADLGCAGHAPAELPGQCRALTGDPMALRECLQSEVDASYLEALAVARTVAARADRATGREIAVLALEASQHAWEA